LTPLIAVSLKVLTLEFYSDCLLSAVIYGILLELCKARCSINIEQMWDVPS